MAGHGQEFFAHALQATTTIRVPQDSLDRVDPTRDHSAGKRALEIKRLASLCAKDKIHRTGMPGHPSFLDGLVPELSGVRMNVRVRGEAGGVRKPQRNNSSAVRKAQLASAVATLNEITGVMEQVQITLLTDQERLLPRRGLRPNHQQKPEPGPQPKKAE
jgi:hypothetical protein